MKTTEGFRLRTVMGQATLVGEGIAQIDFNKLITLNATAAYLWQSVEGRDFTVDDLARLLTQRYGIDPARALQDATDISEAWIKIGIVQESENGERQ